MKKILVVILAIVMVFAFAACSSGGDEPEASGGDVVKVGFIYIGTTNDGGYTQAQHEGTMALEAAMEGQVECLIVEEVAEDKKAVTDAAVNLIDQGCSVIIGTSYGFQDALIEMATSGDYADISFLHFSGNELADNYGNYFGAMEEPRYLSGVIAGKMTTTNKLGYVAAHPYTEVNIGINAFTLGAQSVNPNVEVDVIYIGSWYDPANEKLAAERLLEQGCDVITQHADTTGPQIAAVDAGAWTIGYNLDNSSNPELASAYLTAPIWHHEVFLVPTIQSIIDGTWVPEAYYGTMADGYISLAPLTDNVSEEAKAEVDKVQDTIIKGEKKVFTGPIYDNSGTLKVAEGESLDHDGIWSIDYLVQGVKASNIN
ncbi:MAG: BMP family ABC transporter substrate-binding protein [Clostridiales Family XIII bacterium]|jgi:basic membrane protein A|nr:BMP family ABC transporter substrate-binding protein [Clostridiales Family XIII bacterium]